MTGHASNREIIAHLEKIGDGDVTRGFQLLCVAARICPRCGASWDNPGFTCECMNVLAGES